MNFGGRGEGSGTVHSVAAGKYSMLAAPAKDGDLIEKKRMGVGWQLTQFPIGPSDA